jgi:hypothetical protein
LQIVELIREDLATTLVFLELPHEPIGNISPSLNALNIGHTRLNDSRLAECFRTINQIFQQLHSDPEPCYSALTRLITSRYTRRRIAVFVVSGRV